MIHTITIDCLVVVRLIDYIMIAVLTCRTMTSSELSIQQWVTQGSISKNEQVLLRLKS